MAWIELHDTLPDHDKVLSVAETLKLDKDMVVGKLIRLWVWALNNREDGTFKARDIDTIAEVMRFKGKPQKLINALVAAKLLDCTEDKFTGEVFYVIHDWHERVGMLLAKRETVRAQTRARVQKSRSKKNGNGDVTQGNAECNALQSCYTTSNVTQCNAVTVPKPYQDDDDDDEDDIPAYPRAGDLDEDAAAYAEADRVVCAAFRTGIGREATPSELEAISRIAVMSGKTGLIGEAIRRAGLYGVKSITTYVGKIIREWAYQELDTMEELARFDYLWDCSCGKASGMEPEEAFKQMQEFREEKKLLRGGF